MASAPFMGQFASLLALTLFN